MTRAIQAYRRLNLATAPPNDRARPQVNRAIHLNAGQLERLVTGYQAGATVYELAAEFGIDRKTVSRQLKTAGVTMRRSAHTPTSTEVDEMVQLYESGLSLARVGDRLGFVPRTIHRHLTYRGVQMRDLHGRERS